MSHLLAISVGPVQEFIAAARRTRDLWFGSYLLSEISRAVAKAVEHEGGRLIFPASSNSRVAKNVANVILAELHSGKPKTIADEANKAADECWKRYVAQAKTDAGNAIQDEPEIWESQIGDVIEFYAAWVARTENYKLDRARVMRLLAGRKNCRDFQQPHLKDDGLPKSSLDGQRTSVFVQPAHRSQRDELRKTWPVALRLSAGEELDVVGVTKRLGKKSGEQRPNYSSVARVAADPWLRGIEKHPLFGELHSVCDAVPGLNRVREEKYQEFPFEGTVVFRSRHEDLKVELGEQSVEPLRKVQGILERIGSEPNPYLAVLVADGDRMGAAIAELDSPDKHREFSTALAGFADEAGKIVTKHNGVLVYAGGDDVLAFLPVDNALQCARDLHGKFGDALKNYKNDEGKSPTLSVGIAIGHFMENLEDLLEYGRAAEKAAKKPDRDGLAVHLHKRGGAPVRIRAKWGENPDDRLNHFAELMNRKVIPTKLSYELRAMAKLYEEWPNADVAIQQDLYRLIAKKTSSGEKTVRKELKKYISEMNSNKLSTLAEELLVARQIALAIKQAGGEA